MNYGAFGLVEVVGSSNAILVIDQMLKTSDVSFLTWQTKCGGHATVFLTGDVSAVTAAVDSVKGNPPCEIVASAVISNPSGETVRLAEEEATHLGLVFLNQPPEGCPVVEYRRLGNPCYVFEISHVALSIYNNVVTGCRSPRRAVLLCGGHPWCAR